MSGSLKYEKTNVQVRADRRLVAHLWSAPETKRLIIIQHGTGIC